MLAKIAEHVPQTGDFLFEPKWDGFRAIVFRSADDVYIQSRDLKPLDRYFPELHAVFLAQLPKGVVVDGEIVMPTKRGLDFGGLQMRLHPAASRVEKLAKAAPAAFVAFDLLANGKSLMRVPQRERRMQLEKLFKKIRRPLYLTPMTRDPKLAVDWLQRFEGAGLDGVIAKPAGASYEPGKRAMFKIKHVRSADCVVAGFRWHKTGKGVLGSLLLGLYDDDHTLHHVGVAAAFTATVRKQLVVELTPLRADALEDHPWRDWAVAQEEASAKGQRRPGATSRWTRGKDLSWEPLRPERVCEVAYDHMQGARFRHAAKFLRWRPDKRPQDCRYDQLEVTPAYELDRVFGARDGSQPCGAAGQGS